MLKLLPGILLLKKLNTPQVRRVAIAVFVITALLTPPLSNIILMKVNAGALSPAKLMINNSQAGASGVTYQARFTTSVTTSIKQLTILFL